MKSLIFVIQLRDGMGNGRRLRVSMGADRALSYQLTDKSGQGFALSNMQLREPFPAWAAKGELRKAIAQIQHTIAGSVYSYNSHETSPEVENGNLS